MEMKPEIPQSPPKQVSHDLPAPQAFVDFMLRDWKPHAAKPTPPVKHAAAFAARRRALSKLFPGETLVIPTGHEKLRSNDSTFRFRPGSEFYYLTGNLDPDCVLVLEPRPDGGHTDVLFVEPNPGRSDQSFFTDRAKGELWVGPRLGVEESRQRYGVDQARGLPELADYLASLPGGAARGWRLARGLSAKIDAALPEQAERDKQLVQALHEMRILKEELEVRELSAAIAATHRALEDVIRAFPTLRSEREVEGIFNMRARVEGNDVGYGTIAAAGANACVLHWTRNDGAVRKGDLVLIDAGIEGKSLYTADITRSFPVSGRFSPAQREVYDLVQASQQAAFKKCRAGEDFLAPHRAAMEVLAHGLERMGILRDAAEALKEENQLYRRYTLHGVSHMLGLEVHDAAQARKEMYQKGKQLVGMVFTIEPGLYFQADDLTVPARYRGIGVRIEDDILITEKGHRNLSKAIPRESREVEEWMAKVWKAAKKGKSRR